MTQKITVLGAGRVGRVIARDLAEEPSFAVTLADRDAETVRALAGRSGCTPHVADLTDPAALARAVRDADLAVGALPGFVGLACMRAAIAAGVERYVDISFLPEDPRAELDAEAREAGVTVLYDMGVAPGMSNLLLAHAVRHVAPARRARYLVGGLPVVRRLPWEYEAPFSPIDVVEEYTRPARFKRGGAVVSRPALSDLELFSFESIGTLEGFLTDGLRSLLDTVDCPDMEEKTLRYPGHAERIRVLADSGFFDDREIQVGAARFSARDATFALLDEAWRQTPRGEEFTVMRIEVEGGEAERDGASGSGEGATRATGPTRVTWELLDHTDLERGETSMARTTGFPAAIAAQGLLRGWISLAPGIHPPERLAKDDAVVERFLAELAARGVHYQRTVDAP